MPARSSRARPIILARIVLPPRKRRVSAASSSSPACRRRCTLRRQPYRIALHSETAHGSDRTRAQGTVNDSSSIMVAETSKSRPARTGQSWRHLALNTTHPRSRTTNRMGDPTKLLKTVCGFGWRNGKSEQGMPQQSTPRPEIVQVRTGAVSAYPPPAPMPVDGPQERFQLGEDSARRLAASRQSSALLGDVVSLLFSPKYRESHPRRSQWLVTPGLASGQFQIAEGLVASSGARLPMGLVLWASVSKRSRHGFGRYPGKPQRLRPDEWKSGDTASLPMATGFFFFVQDILVWLISSSRIRSNAG